MNSLIASMNHILSQWTEQFDLHSTMTLSFRLDDGGTVSLNDIPLSIAATSTLQHARFDPRHIIFYLDGNQQIHLVIFWPSEEPPRLLSVITKISE